ncbi:MAG TPA: hypothetical protein PLR83_02125 [Pyrinomonadaceae bacterium]|nr:hypothetical protein [Pyrinomonadaceae bacterium]
MFEQSIYEVNEPAKPAESGDFLFHYEVRTWDWTPRFYKIVGAVAVVNLLLLVGVAQTSLLTTKGCDSPFVGRVCSVIDAVYVGSMLFGTDRDFVDKQYEHTELGNGDFDVTMIDVGGENAPLDYPQGYFQIANRDEYQAMLDAQNDPNGLTSGMLAPGIPNSTPFPRPSTGSDITNTKPKYAKPNKNSVVGELPGLGDSDGKKDKRDHDVADNGTNGGIPGIPNSNGVKVDPKNPTAGPTEPLAPGEINRLPFKDLAKMVNDLPDDKRAAVLNSQFIVEASGKLGKDGHLDKKSFRITRAESTDKEAVAVLKRSIEAFNDSGFLSILSDLSGKTLTMSMQQDEANLGARAASQLESPESASSKAAGLRVLADLARRQKEDAIKQMQSVNDPANAEKLQNALDDLDLLNATTISSEGRNLVIQLNVPKEMIQKIVDRKLAKERALQQQNDKVNLSTEKRSANGRTS